MKSLKRDKNCQRCSLHKDAEFVCLLGTGNEKSDVVIVGEAPGKREDDSGKPFVGSAGKVLFNALEEVGIKREDVFTTNAVACRPPDNRTPRKIEVKACRYWLNKQLGKVKPKIVLLLGNIALQGTLDLTGIKKLRGRPIERDGTIYFPTFHPSFVLRDSRQESVFKADLAFFAEIVKHGEIPKEPGLDYEIVNDVDSLARMYEDLYGTISFATETTGLYPWEAGAQVVSLGFATARKQWCLPLNHPRAKWTRKQKRKIIKQLDGIIPNCFVATQNGKFDSLWMRVHYGVEWQIDFDTMLAHFLLDENSRHDLDFLSQSFFGALPYDVPLEVKQGKAGTLEEHCEYLAKDLMYTRKLKFRLAKMLNKEGDIKRVFEHILMPCANLFTEVEYRGVYIDVSRMKEVEQELNKRLAKAKKELDKWGPGINWRSPKQIGKLLFEDLGIDPIEQTKTGANSTSESVIKRIDHPIAKAILDYRGAAQQLSFFIDGWKPFLTEENRLHPSFKLHGTVTGRLSCEHPNLQQVPRDKFIRSLIGAPAGWVLIEADLSQIELRIAAELAGERRMLEAFQNGIDVHWLTALREMSRGGAMAKLVKRTAKKISGKKLPYGDAIEVLLKAGADAAEDIYEEWKELRKKAKAINFGYLYGMWWKKFKMYARDNYGVEVTDQQAQQSREAFFELYSDFPEWHRRQRRYAKRHGFVRSLSGRKRRLPDAQMPYDNPRRREAERQAINSPVQSFASDINLMAALQLREEYGPEVVQLVGTVHDSLLVEVKEEYAEEVYCRILEIMKWPKLMDEFEIKMSVPIEAEAGIGSWGTGRPLEEWKEAA